MTITRREYKANLDFSKVDSWNAHGKYVTHFLNSLSAYFPPGEKFFLDAVLAYRKQLQHIPGIESDIRGFVGQEVQHGKMHEQYDLALKAAGYPADAIEKLTGKALKTIQRSTSKSFQLALTVAAEHYTATMANYLLESDVIDKADPSYAWLWKVHAVEEVEHRCVSFDVYDQVGSYKERMIAYFLTSLALMPIFVITTLLYISKDKSVTLINPTEWKSWIKVMASLYRSIGPELIKFIDPSYHPAEMKISGNYAKIKSEVF